MILRSKVLGNTLDQKKHVNFVSFTRSCIEASIFFSFCRVLFTCVKWESSRDLLYLAMKEACRVPTLSRFLACPGDEVLEPGGRPRGPPSRPPPGLWPTSSPECYNRAKSNFYITFYFLYLYMYLEPNT